MFNKVSEKVSKLFSHKTQTAEPASLEELNYRLVTQSHINLAECSKHYAN